jgi:hypothetical protein
LQSPYTLASAWDSSRNCARWSAPERAWRGGIPISERHQEGLRRTAQAICLLLAIANSACVGGPRGTVRQALPRLELVDLLELPAGTSLDGVPLGGLSALAWDAAEDQYYALADDRGEHGPPRLYRLRLPFDGTPGVEVLSWRPLTDPDGAHLVPGIADPEGMARLPDGSLLIASEGLADDGVAPFLRRFSADGRHLDEIELPNHYLPTPDGERGVRSSLGFESLTFEPDGGRAYLATEGALAQDGPQADLAVASTARLIILSWPGAKPLAEHAYVVEPVRLAPQPDDGFRVAGLVELLAVGPDRLLALERQFAVGAGFSLRLYAVGLTGATNLRQIESLADSEAPRPVCKELLLDFADLEIEPRNLEGLSWGPELADGRRTIIVVEDDNFDAGPAARFLRLAPRELRAASWLPLARSCW